jgi:hypothetical protein
MTEEIKLSAGLQRRIELLVEVSNDVHEKKQKLQTSLEDILREVEEACANSVDDNDDDEYTSPEDLFIDSDLKYDLDNVAFVVGGQIGGEGGSTFEFWIPSTC